MSCCSSAISNKIMIITRRPATRAKALPRTLELDQGFGGQAHPRLTVQFLGTIRDSLQLVHYVEILLSTLGPIKADECCVDRFLALDTISCPAPCDRAVS